MGKRGDRGEQLTSRPRRGAVVVAATLAVCAAALLVTLALVHLGGRSKGLTTVSTMTTP